MGRIRNGANGGFKGKAGSVIGSSWKSIDYIKGLYKKRTKPATEEQLMQQAKFLLITQFLFPIKALLRIGYGLKKASTHTAMNMALQANIRDAVTGTYPDFALDYAKVRLSTGGLFNAGNETMSVEDGELLVTWNTKVNQISGHADDVVYILLYHPTSEQFLTTDELPVRGDGEARIEIPDHMSSGEAHVWIFLAERKATEVSKSIYLGNVSFD
ncbi:hypothetical protein H8S90_10605 [Olivibacter sp. SDN3]|uniref:DUF6266 family protein n=1 Tax=Olivibacter sp. SDN3 TaxID=2764720 RepID=UPI0016518484|nr:DUF6266 family protein [Olivibacter sp. SDN3]QNL51978.1 hypothetical protein H8S90_10605 [Olivibacter sp. SDN3]